MLSLQPHTVDHWLKNLPADLDAKLLLYGAVRFAHTVPTKLPDFAESHWWVQDAATQLPV
ncbi:MAG: hypothetical protein HRT36_01835 [Alphaproteobacteria bacterium]|nr:hypothetical protein [Alphaproteobacteria bacterium]